MFVIRLPNGNLQVPETAIGKDGRVIGDAYVEIGPEDTDYARLAEQAMTPEEAEQRRQEWRAGDAALHREFLEFARLVGDQYWPGQDPEADLAVAARSRGPRLSGARAQVKPLGAPPVRVQRRRAAVRAPRIRGTVDARLACGCW
jgi:hypothetical protein